MLATLLLSAPVAGAEEAPGPVAEDESWTAQAKGLFDDIWGRDALFGSGDLRARLASHGILLAGDSVDEALSNLSGGVQPGTYSDGRLELAATIDLGKAIGWPGATFHSNAYWTHGKGVSGAALGGNLMTVSNIEATNSVRLFDLWIEQLLFDDQLSIRAGQLAADDEFFASDTASNFDNATFGWPAILGADLPGGGPVYDLATPGLRVKYSPGAALSFSAAIFNGNPAGNCGQAPQVCNPSGLDFRADGGAFVIAEAAYKSDVDLGYGAIPSSYKLGGWWHNANFRDLATDTSGISLASPLSTGIGALRPQDYGVYAVADAAVWRREGTPDQGVSAFLRAAWTPGDRNLVSLYGDAGLSFKGIIPSRPADVLGVALAYAQIGSGARGFDKTARRFSGIASPVRDHEAVLELTYRFQANAWWTLQPDVQYILHPGANVPLPSSATRPVPNALVIGVRSSVVF